MDFRNGTAIVRTAKLFGKTTRVIRYGPSPQSLGRDTGIAAVMLMDAQIDHVTGLLMLREHGQALPLYATREVFSDLSDGFALALAADAN